MCSSFANQEGACAHVVCFAECLISLLGKPGSEGLKHIAPKLEEMMRLQNAAKRLFAKSSSIITEIDGIVSGEVGERNTAARTRMFPLRPEIFDPGAVCDPTATGVAGLSFLRFMLLVRSLG